MRLLLLLPVALAALAFLAAAHVYIGRRLLLESGLPEPWRSGGLVLLALLGASLLLQPVVERRVRPPWSRLVAWPASLWMGLAFLLLWMLPLSDLVLWLGAGSALAAPPVPGVAAAAPLRAAAVLALALLAGAAGLRSALSPPRLVRLEIALARWPRALDGFRIVQISDLHLGPILGGRFAERLVERVQALSPDLVAVTGDLVDGGVAQVGEEVEPLARLAAPHGVYFVTGNHDHLSGAGPWSERVRQLGMRVLRNERVEVRAHGAVFDVVGVDDHRGDLLGGEGGEDLDAALAGRDPERPALLLAHDPSTFRRACRLGIDLQLSGHTHGGQIWPFGWLVRLVIPFVAGRYRRHGAELYVSRGTGFWGPPMRLRAPAELTEIVLRAGPRPPDGVR
jgi:predicted MPP superfamily phosphohydrolase